MSVRIVFMHGFGYDATVFEPLARHLKEHEIHYLDFGFFGAAQKTVTTSVLPTFVIGHSLGVLRYMATQPFPVHGLVSLAGFTQFCASDDFPQGVAPVLVKRMQKKLLRNPHALLNEFYNLCGDKTTSISPDATTDTEALSRGLDDLLQLDMRSVALPETLALAGNNDAVTPPTLQKALFYDRPGVTFVMHENAPHALPLTHTNWCADHINAFIRRFI